MKILLNLFPFFVFCLPSLANAEVIDSGDNGFVLRDTALLDADAIDIWLALIKPGNWWTDTHTWTGDSRNLSLTPQAGGCFCERIPEDIEADRITLEGSVEHMRVIQAYPERVLRMRGGLGPLQSEPATGVLTIVISEVAEGVRVVWEYVVGGYMRYKSPIIAPAIDNVMKEQFASFTSQFSRIEVPMDTIGEQVEPLPEDEPETGLIEPIASDLLTLEEEIDSLGNK